MAAWRSRRSEERGVKGGRLSLSLLPLFSPSCFKSASKIELGMNAASKHPAPPARLPLFCSLMSIGS